MRVEVGDLIAHEALVDRGFIHRTIGTVDWIDRSLASPDGVCVVQIYSAFAYHPCDPQEGRDIGPGGVRKTCFDCEACVVIGRKEKA